MLEEIGAPYELTVTSWEQGSGEEHRARHPLGRVPVVQFDDGYVFESAAICLQLADLYPDASLIGALGTHARALAYQWSIFAPAELEPPLIEAAIFREADPERAGKARARFFNAANAVVESRSDRGRSPNPAPGSLNRRRPRVDRPAVPPAQSLRGTVGSSDQR